MKAFLVPPDDMDWAVGELAQEGETPAEQNMEKLAEDVYLARYPYFMVVYKDEDGDLWPRTMAVQSMPLFEENVFSVERLKEILWRKGGVLVFYTHRKDADMPERLVVDRYVSETYAHDPGFIVRRALVAKEIIVKQ